MFLPYKLDCEKNAIPFITIVICIACILVYWQQYSKDQKHIEAQKHFCSVTLGKNSRIVLNSVVQRGSKASCYSLFEEIRESNNVDETIAILARDARPTGLFETKEDEVNYVKSRLLEYYHLYDRQVPPPLTRSLAYDPKEIDLFKMITSTFSHGSVVHLGGNILFFYIFAASVELIMGSFMFLGFIVLATIGTSLAYSYASSATEHALPTIGLSGVVMAAVCALAVMMPKVRIRCFLWLIVYFKVFRIPAALLAVWYVGWDLLSVYNEDGNGYVNYTAHISGAAIGALIGLYYVWFKRDLLEYAIDGTH